MKKLKLMTVVGTRPEIIRLAEVIKRCDLYFDHLLVHTGQNYDYTLNGIFFEELELRQPDYFLESVGADLGETIGNIISKSYKLLKEQMPDALLILGDTNSCLCAISAKRLKIPVFHMEAGNRCFDENLPEEINRRIVDHIADVNLPYTEHSRRYLLSEGVAKNRIFVTGSPMREVLERYRDKIDASNAVNELGLEEGKYFLVSAHREENLDIEHKFVSLMQSLNVLAEEYGLPIIYSTHPRSQKKLDASGFKFNPLVKNLPPFGFFDYNRLQKSALCVLSDSGTLPEESAILDFCGVSLRNSTERPEVLDKGTVVIGGANSDDVLSAVNLAIAMKRNNEPVVVAPDYMDENVSVKVVKIIESYTKIVNEFVWRKPR